MRPIIINGRFLLHRTTGVERYAREIIAELDKTIPAGSITMAVPPEIENVPVYQNIKVIKTGKFKIGYGNIFLFRGMCINKKESP